MNYLALSEAAIFIASAYLFAFLPWTILNALDFIRAEWKTVKATRRSGYYHFFLVLIPLPLIILYILVTWNALEFPEACAAFLVLYVSITHFIRTSWGLWQVYLFHSWATEAIEAMERMGYKYKLRLALRRPKKEIKSRDERKDTNENQDRHEDVEDDNEKNHSKYMSAAEIANLILVNDTVIDNQIFHGETQCYIEYWGEPLCFIQDPYGEIPVRKKLLQGIKLLLILPIIPLIWMIDVLRHRFGYVLGHRNAKPNRGHIKSKSFYNIHNHNQFNSTENETKSKVQYGNYLLQLPHKPVDVWLKWASVFASQGLHEWIDQVALSTSNQGNQHRHKKVQYKARRDQFGGQLLAGMCHLSNMSSSSSMDESENISTISTMWDNSDNASNGVLKKKELLLKACKSGGGLPFGAGHVSSGEDRGIIEGLDDTSVEKVEEFEGYKGYGRKLERLVESLPVAFGSKILEFDVEVLEWLTIFLHLGWMKNEIGKEIAEEKTSIEEEIESDDNKRKRKTCPRKIYPPYQNLLSQYGFSKQKQTGKEPFESDLNRETLSHNQQQFSSSKLSWRNITAFPFGKDYISEKCMEVSQYNRHVLKVSEVSDVWIQLEAGKHYKFLQEKNKLWKSACLGTEVEKVVKNIKSMNQRKSFNNYVNRKTEEDQDTNEEIDRTVESNKPKESDSNGPIRSPSPSKESQHHEKQEYREIFRQVIRERQEKAELSRLGYQLGENNQKYRHMEHTLTFMGYCMEHVRSELGEWMWKMKVDGPSEIKIESERPITAEERTELMWRPEIGNALLNEANSNSWTTDIMESVGTHIGLLSRSLSTEMLRTEDRRWFERRSVQVRLIWEVQQILQEKMHVRTEEKGGGPGDVVSMILCILSFPALIVHVTGDRDECILDDNQVSNEPDDMNEESLEIADDEDGNCMIGAFGVMRKMRMGGKRDENVVSEKLKLSIIPQCAPQDLHVIIKFGDVENGRVRIGIRLGKKAVEKEDIEESSKYDAIGSDIVYEERFEWEWWRDSFLSRLEGLSAWQNMHGMESVRYEDTPGRIEEEVERENTLAMGTGKSVPRIWKGWRAFRESFCRFELQSPMYITTYIKSGVLPIERETPVIANVRMLFKLGRMKRVCIDYSKAGWQELYNSTVALRRHPDYEMNLSGDKENMDEESSSVEDRIEQLLKEGKKADAQRKLFLLQESSIETGKEESLKQCVELLSDGKYFERDLERAMVLLEAFVSGGITENESEAETATETDRRMVIAGRIAVGCAEEFAVDDMLMKRLCRLVLISCYVQKNDNNIDDQMYWLFTTPRRLFLEHGVNSMLDVMGANSIKFLAKRAHVFRKKKQEREENENMVDVKDKNKGVIQSELSFDKMNWYSEGCLYFERSIHLFEKKKEQLDVMMEFAVLLDTMDVSENDRLENKKRASELFEQITEQDPTLVAYIEMLRT